MKIEKLNKTEEMTSVRAGASEIKEGEQSDFQALLNDEAMNNLALASQGMDFVNTDLLLELDSLKISRDDAMFFVDLTKNPQFSMTAAQNQLINLGELTSAGDIQGYKSMEVSKGLFSLISKAHETQKPVRLDFDNNVTIIMKVDKEGKISAEFIPGDKAVEAYLRNNIPFLRQRFEEQNIAYNDLYYRHEGRQQQSQRRNNKGDSENE